MKQRFTNPRKRPSVPAPSRRDAGPAGSGGGGGTQAVDRALAILLALGGARADWGISELAAELGLHKTTVFRILGALQRDGFVARDSARQTFHLGPSVIRLGAQARRSAGLHGAARAVLEELAADTGEAATLEVLVGDEVLILDEVHGRFLVGSVPEIGTHWPAHAASTGKVLLAAARFGAGGDGARGDGARPPSGRGRLARLGPNTITSRAALDAELAEVWRRGYAVGVEEVEAGFVAVGAPVRNSDGHVVAAVSVGGPKHRFTTARVGELARLVRHAADRVSERLGASPAPLNPPSASRVTPPAHGPSRPSSLKEERS